MGRWPYRDFRDLLFPRSRFAVPFSIRNSLPQFGHSRLASRITSIGELKMIAVRQYGQTTRCSWNTSLVARFTDPIFYCGVSFLGVCSR